MYSLRTILLLSLAITGLILVSCTEEPSEKLASALKEKVTSESSTFERPASYSDAYKVVDEMPLFGDCKDYLCSDEQLIKYIYDHLTYPADARTAEKEGRVFIQFIVSKDGHVKDARIVRDFGYGSGESALAVVEKMNDLGKPWTPGRKDGAAVDVLYTLPVAYKLEG